MRFELAKSARSCFWLTLVASVLCIQSDALAQTFEQKQNLQLQNMQRFIQAIPEDRKLRLIDDAISLKPITESGNKLIEKDRLKRFFVEKEISAFSKSELRGLYDIFNRMADPDQPTYPLGKKGPEWNWCGNLCASSDSAYQSAWDNIHRNMGAIGRLSAKMNVAAGTIFHIRDGVFLTAGHVVRDHIQETNGQISPDSSRTLTFYTSNDSNGISKTYKVFSADAQVYLRDKDRTNDPALDVAIIFDPTLSGLPSLKSINSTIYPHQSSSLFILGFPNEAISSEVSLRERLIKYLEYPTIAPGSVWHPVDARQGMIYYSANTTPGNSGSPIFDDQGGLIGIHVGYEKGRQMPIETRTTIPNHGVSVIYFADWYKQITQIELAGLPQ